MKIFNFTREQSKFVNDGEITQTCLKLDDVTMHIRKGEIYDIFFDNIRLSDKFLMVEKVRKTNLYRLSSRDIQKNGFEYRPFFIEHYARNGISEDDSVVAVDFALVDRDFLLEKLQSRLEDGDYHRSSIVTLEYEER